MTYKIENGWLIDKDNNRANINFWGSRAEAAESLESLVDCRGCVNCDKCESCICCTLCTECFSCYDCARGKGLSGEFHRHFRISGDWIVDRNNNRASIGFWGSEAAAIVALKSLKDCRYCVNCSDCDTCTDCSHCRNCQYTWKSKGLANQNLCMNNQPLFA